MGVTSFMQRPCNEIALSTQGSFSVQIRVLSTIKKTLLLQGRSDHMCRQHRDGPDRRRARVFHPGIHGQPTGKFTTS